MWPHRAHRRRWNHQPSAARHSTHPGPLGGTVASISSVIVTVVREGSSPSQYRYPGRRGLDADDDLAHRAAVLDELERLDDLAERIPAVDDGLELAGGDQLLQGLDVSGVHGLPPEHQTRPLVAEQRHERTDNQAAEDVARLAAERHVRAAGLQH